MEPVEYERMNAVEDHMWWYQAAHANMLDALHRFPAPAGQSGYQMGHSSYLYFIDKKGMLRAMMPFGRPADEMVHDVNVLAAE